MIAFSSTFLLISVLFVTLGSSLVCGPQPGISSEKCAQEKAVCEKQNIFLKFHTLGCSKCGHLLISKGEEIELTTYFEIAAKPDGTPWHDGGCQCDGYCGYHCGKFQYVRLIHFKTANFCQNQKPLVLPILNVIGEQTSLFVTFVTRKPWVQPFLSASPAQLLLSVPVIFIHVHFSTQARPSAGVITVGGNWELEKK